MLQDALEGPTTTDVVFELTETEDGMQGRLICSSDVFSRASADRLASSLQVFTNHIVCTPPSPTGRPLSLLLIASSSSFAEGVLLLLSAHRVPVSSVPMHEQEQGGNIQMGHAL